MKKRLIFSFGISLLSYCAFAQTADDNKKIIITTVDNVDKENVVEEEGQKAVPLSSKKNAEPIQSTNVDRIPPSENDKAHSFKKNPK